MIYVGDNCVHDSIPFNATYSNPISIIFRNSVPQAYSFPIHTRPTTYIIHVATTISVQLHRNSFPPHGRCRITAKASMISVPHPNTTWLSAQRCSTSATVSHNRKATAMLPIMICTYFFIIWCVSYIYNPRLPPHIPLAPTPNSGNR